MSDLFEGSILTVGPFFMQLQSFCNVFMNSLNLTLVLIATCYSMIYWNKLYFDRMSGRRESILISDVSPQKSKAVFICPILKEMA